MATIVLVEHPATLPALRAAVPADAIWCAFSAPAAQALMAADLPYFLPEECGDDYHDLSHGILAARAQARRALARLDDLLLALDERWARRGLRPFSHCQFDGEVPVMALATRLLQIAAVFAHHRPAEVVAADFGPLSAPDVRFIDDGSLVNAAAERQCRRCGCRWRLLPHVPVRQGAAFPVLIPAARPRTWQESKRALRLRLALWQARSRGHRRRRLLNVDCHELRCCDAALARLGWEQRQFPSADLYQATAPARRPYAQLPALRGAAWADAGLREMLTIDGSAAAELLLPPLLTLTARFPALLDQYDWLQEYVARRDWEAAVFPSHAGWYAQQHLLPLILRQQHIPYACWMHGGLGANMTEAGYGSADFLLGDRFFVFGEAVREVFTAHFGIAAERISVTGSPWLEGLYAGAGADAAPARPRVVLVMGTFALPLNDIHTGEAQRDLRSGFWRWLTALLPVLAKHQARYDMVIRPYPGGGSEQVQAVHFLADRAGLRDWRLQTQQQCRLRDLLCGAQAVILPWVSTAFFEATLTEADIFLGNDSDLTATAAGLVAKRARHQRTPAALAAVLDDYLAAGGPRQQQDAGFARAFLDSDHRQRRAARVAEALEAWL